MDDIKPFSEEILESDVYIRTFKEDIDQDTLLWHRDKEDRIIESIGETDWTFQIDNELPQKLNKELFIARGIYHRLIKGNGDLVLKVNKLK